MNRLLWCSQLWYTIIEEKSNIALGVCAYLGLSENEVNLLEQGLNAIAVGVLTLLGVFGVIKNFDKPNDEE